MGRGGGEHGEGKGWERGGEVTGWRDAVTVGPGNPHPDASCTKGVLSVSPSRGATFRVLLACHPGVAEEEKRQAEEGVCWLCFLLIRRYDFSVICMFGTK